MKKKLFFASVFLLGLVGAYAQTGYVLKIGYAIQSTLCAAPLFIAVEKGFYEEEGLAYEAVKIDNTQIPALLTAGQIDVTNHLLAVMIQPLANGLDAKIPLALHTGCIKVLVDPKSSIQRPEDLKGKRIGVPGMGGSPTLITQRYLAKRGIGTVPPKLEVEWFVYPMSELGLALERGQVDAIALSDPIAQIIQNNGKGRAIIDTAVDAEIKDEFCCALVASGAAAKTHPEELAKFTRAIQKASKFVQENPDETAKIIADKKYVAGDPKVNAGLLRNFNYRASVSEAKIAIDRNAKDLQKIGLVNKNVNVARLTNTVFLPLKGVPDSLYK
ncbi:MAG: ABC transporter substrate-binding protein [Spirochaetaceae bacterium]|jgi:NitT/TauT family transport system substrate-binding protein|nr:ABC transporter substrate-binding protein [Spirochaetaceae bacterium]